jgi:O-antigen/teichoic acid export membrane protein
VPGLVGRIIAVRTPIAVAVFLLTLAAAALQPDPEARLAVAILASLILVDTANLAWVFLGLEQMRLVALSTNIGMALATCGVLLLVRDSSQVGLAALLTVGGELAAAALLLWVFLRRHGPPVVQFDRAFSRSMLAQSFPFAAVAVLAVVRYNFDVILIGLVLGETQTGLYSAPYRILAFLISMVAAYFTALLPTLARCYVSDPARGQRLVNRSVQLVALAVLPTAVGGTILATEIVTLLFGPAYESGAEVFRVLIWVLVPLCLAGGYRNLFRAYNRQSLEMRAVAFSAAANIALNLVLVPSVGLLGAATATLAGEVVLLGSCWRSSRTLLSGAISPGVVLRPLAAALGMGAVLVLLPARPLVVSLAVGPLVYFPLLVLLHGLTWADVRGLCAQLPRSRD